MKNTITKCFNNIKTTRGVGAGAEKQKTLSNLDLIIQAAHNFYNKEMTIEGRHINLQLLKVYLGLNQVKAVKPVNGHKFLVYQHRKGLLLKNQKTHVVSFLNRLVGK